MIDNIKFNVIIPTRERADTLFYCLRTVIAQDYENLRIIISDNFSQDNTKAIVDSLADPRITYINTGKRISMSHNWEFALGHVTDGWVTILGDDDGLLPGALSKVAGVIKKTKCQAIASRWCWYNWPNCSTANNRLIVPLTSGVELRSGREWLAKLMHGDASYLDMPCLYTGGFSDIVAINRARDQKGNFFLSMIPDIYSSIALASVIDNYIMLKEPVAVAGRSIHSTGASWLGIGSNLDPVKKYYSEENISFHSILAGGEATKSIQIAVYESYLQSIHLHHNFLNIKLEDQLGLALSRIGSKYYNNLRKYCITVTSSNNVKMDVVERTAGRYKKGSLLRQLKILTDYLLRRRTIYCNEFGVQDVCGAALLARATFLLETRYAHWRLDNLSRLIGMLSQHILALLKKYKGIDK